MPRSHIEFIFAQDLPWLDACPLAGRGDCSHKLLSRDNRGPELTAILRFPPGWSGTVGSLGQEEVYVLDGSITIGGHRLGRDGYFRLPAQRPYEWLSESGAVVIVFVNEATPDDDPEVVAIDAVAMPWSMTDVPPELDFMGIARKALFVDRDTGRHRTWLLAVGPQIAPKEEYLAIETHSCCEEVFMLSGDITGPRGEMAPGAYFWRPRDIFHGPFGSRNGGLAISRFRHGIQDTVFHGVREAFAFEAPYRPELPPELEHLAQRDSVVSARY